MQEYEYKLSTSDFKDLSTTGFHFQMTYDDSQGSILQPAIHSHDFYEIVFIIDGFCTHTINAVDLPCNTGDLFFLKPDDVHYFKDCRKKTSVMCLSVANERIEEITALFSLFKNSICMFDSSTVIKLSNSQKAVLNPIYMSIFSSITNSAYQTDKMKLILVNVLQFISFDFLPSVDESQSIRNTMTINNILSQMSLPENIKGGMSSLLKITNFSHSHLCRVFKNNYNMTPHNFIRNIKMNYAFELIAYSNLSFEQVSESVGFSSLSHFIKIFTASFGQSPYSVRSEYKHLKKW